MIKQGSIIKSTSKTNHKRYFIIWYRLKSEKEKKYLLKFKYWSPSLYVHIYFLLYN
jgi:hypothetical protein